MLSLKSQIPKVNTFISTEKTRKIKLSQIYTTFLSAKCKMRTSFSKRSFPAGNIHWVSKREDLHNLWKEPSKMVITNDNPERNRPTLPLPTFNACQPTQKC